MNSLKNHLIGLGTAVLALMSSAQFASAQYFTNTGFGDLLVGFRKTGSFQGNYQVVVDAGNVSNLLALSPGMSIPIPNYSSNQLNDAFPTGLGNLQWSVFSTAQVNTSWTNSIGVFPSSTVWYTVPCTNVGVQSAAPNRNTHSGQALLDQRMLGVALGAAEISSGLITTNADNNNVLVREAIALDGGGNDTLDDEIADISTPSLGDFGGGTINFTVENVTSNTFTSAVRSDFYQSVPSSKSGATFVDPITGATNGAAYFVGYFLFNPNGTMTFTRATPFVAPPPSPVLTISRVNTTSTISFSTTNGATYNLIYTTPSGVGSPRSTWTTLGSPIIGAGGVTNFMDTTTDPSRIYSVTAH